MPIDQETLDELALSQAEYDLIVDRLDREPNSVELGMFGSLWSEHCGYKHSKPLLRLFPNRSHRVLSKPGEENAGAVDIGDGLAVVFKVESHNHPSAVEPFQGAATGVGGIVRDILAMGARPIALLNSLRFGPLDDPQNRHLFNGVVGGISWYGNCIGIPDVAGEICFDPSYSQNPLVNAMCVGIARKDQLASSAARGVGNVLVLVGADTGRDGIHGASGLASRTFQDEQERRPTVQVGNPFLEKILIEACLEALATGEVQALQDLGAAGLTSAAIESASKAGHGVHLDLAQVHRRESGMTPYEVMLSESQERMLLVVPPSKLDRVKAVFNKWDIPSREIGQVIHQPEAHVFEDSRPVAQLPIQPLASAPRYRLKGVPSPEQKQRQRLSLASIPLPTHRWVKPAQSPLAGEGQACPEPGRRDGAYAPEAHALLKLLGSPNIASKRAVYRQYDHQVQNNTVVGPGSDAAVLRVKGTDKAIALCVDGNGRYCYLDPYRGGQIVVAEVCRNLSCSGAEPLALTDCLNFGNPEKADRYYQLEWCIRGMAAACRALGVPVVSGNVSLYNEGKDQAIYPTPVVGGLGLLEDATRHTRSSFPGEGLRVVLLGSENWPVRASDLAGSEYLQVFHHRVAGRPAIDLRLEARVQKLCRQAIREGILTSAHDCSDGGLAVSLAECCLDPLISPPPTPPSQPSLTPLSPKEAGGISDPRPCGIGFQGGDAFSRLPRRWDAALFGERQSRIVASLPYDQWPRLQRLAQELGVLLLELGATGGDRFALGKSLDLPVTALSDAWSHGLERALGQTA